MCRVDMSISWTLSGNQLGIFWIKLDEARRLDWRVYRMKSSLLKRESRAEEYISLTLQHYVKIMLLDNGNWARFGELFYLDKERWACFVMQFTSYYNTAYQIIQVKLQVFLFIFWTWNYLAARWKRRGCICRDERQKVTTRVEWVRVLAAVFSYKHKEEKNIKIIFILIKMGGWRRVFCFFLNFA